MARATARADELGRDELIAGADGLELKVAPLKPAVVAILGITAYRIAFERRRVTLGRQPEALADSELWVVPNPSGRNAHAQVPALAAAYRDAAAAAGIVLRRDMA